MPLPIRRTFLSRPLWRDYVLAYVLIALGFLFTSPSAPLPRPVGWTILACGLAIFLCAVAWSLRSLCRSRTRR